MENQTTASGIEPGQSDAQQSVASSVQQPASTLSLTQPISQAKPQENKVDFKSLIPESFKEEKSLQNFNDMESFVKSYLHAQKLVGMDKIPVPNKYATDEDWQSVFKKLGAPENPDQYKYSFKEGEVEPESLKVFNQTAHKLGLLPKQAEGLVKFYNELNQNVLQQQEVKAASVRQEAELSLKKEFGPEFNKRLEQAQRLAHSTLGQEFLNNTILNDGSRLGDNVFLVKAFSQLADKLSEDEIVKGEGQGYQTASEIQKEIDSLTEEGSPYWISGHPNHKKAVDEVYKLRQLLNG
jgi:hypothetical protein